MYRFIQPPIRHGHLMQVPYRLDNAPAKNNDVLSDDGDRELTPVSFPGFFVVSAGACSDCSDGAS